MRSDRTPVRVRIAAPNAPAAILLEQRLVHLHPSAIAHGPRWEVHVDDVDDRLDEIEAAVAHWLRDVDLGSTDVDVDGTRRMIRARSAAPAVGIGVDYESEPVLEHEP